MTRYLTQHIGILNMLLGTTLYIFLTGSLVHAGTVTIAVTPSTLDAVDSIAQAFEAVHAGDIVRIMVASNAELKGAMKNLPLHLVVSDDVALIEWMEERNIASRPTGKPGISVPLALVAPLSDTTDFNSTGDLVNRMKQRDAVLTISDPLKTNCGRRAQILLNTFGISAEPSARLVYSKHTEDAMALVRNGKAQLGLVCAPEAMKAKGIKVHGLSAPTTSAPFHLFAVMQGQQNHAVAQRFLAFTNSSEGRNAMRTKGYEPLTDSEMTQTPS
jgi:ABC-type molybdate transport system substrate-binding protein